MSQDVYLRPGDQWTDFTKKHSLERLCPGSFEKDFRGDHQGLGLDYWRIGGGRVVAFFRQPEQRVLSGYVDKLKDFPWKGTKAVSLMDYAKTMEGCQTRMLTRGLSPCGDILGDPTARERAVAKSRVRELAFVGLTDEWDLSVCLFYTMYGGNCTDLAFRNVRPGKGRSRAGAYNATAYLGNWKDRFDGPLYAQAKEVFWERVKQYSVNRTSCARTCAAATEIRPFSVEGESLVLWRSVTEEASSDWPGRRAYDED